MKCRLQIYKKAKTKRRGPYKPRPVALDNRTVVHRSTTIKGLDGEHPVVIESGNMIPDKWIDIYDWFVGRKSTKDWLNCFNSMAPTTFTAANHAEEETSRLV